MTWTAERWARIEALFHAAAAQAPAARAAWLDAACGGDAALRDDVARLLAADAADAPAAAWLDAADGAGAVVRAVDPLLGTQVGAFRLVDHLADGGMGVVYRAERMAGGFAQAAAVKLLRCGFGTAALRERFARERQALARLAHPHVARLLDGGTTPTGLPYIVMELVDGEPLDRYCDARRLPLRARLALFATVCRAVHFAHQNLILHLDLKPGNVLVDRSGAPRLLDFGVAGLLAEAMVPAAGALPTASRPLTPEYASPELLRGEAASTAADVYSLGVVLFELLVGARPFAGGSDYAVAARGLQGAAPRPSDRVAPAAAAARGVAPAALRRALRGDLDRVVARAMAPLPAERYASAQELALDVERHLAGFPVQAQPPRLPVRLAKFARRHRAAVAAGAAVVLALAGGLAAALHQAGIARAERDAAAAARGRAEAEAAHAGVEALSSGLIAAFLRETFLSTQFLDDPALREAALATIERKAAAVRRQYAAAPHLAANLLDALGQACGTFDAFAAAHRLLDEAAARRRDAFGAASLEYALSLGSRGALLHREGRLAEARAALAEALRLHQECPPGVHTDVARAANDLAVVERALGDRERARALHETALAARRRAGDPVAVAESLNNLANSAPDLATARALLEEALRLRREVLGADDPLTLQAQANLANALLSGGEAAAAAALQREVVARCREQRALGREQLTMSLRALAYAELQAGAPERAAAALAEALPVERQRFGPDHLRVAALVEIQAIAAERGGDFAAAAAAWAEVVRIRAQLPAGHPQRLAAATGHGGALLRTGATAAGLQVLGAALAELGAPGPATARQHIDLRLHLASGGEQQGEVAAAEQHLLAAWAAATAADAPAEAAARRATVARYLEAFHRRRGDAAAAARFAAAAAQASK